MATEQYKLVDRGEKKINNKRWTTPAIDDFTVRKPLIWEASGVVDYNDEF